MELRQGRAAIKELIVHTVVSGGTDGKRKEFGKFRCILSSQGGRWEAWCVRGHVAERVERGAHFNWTWRLARKKRGRCVSEARCAENEVFIPVNDAVCESTFSLCECTLGRKSRKLHTLDGFSL